MISRPTPTCRPSKGFSASITAVFAGMCFNSALRRALGIPRCRKMLLFPATETRLFFFLACFFVFTVVISVHFSFVQLGRSILHVSFDHFPRFGLAHLTTGNHLR